MDSVPQIDLQRAYHSLNQTTDGVAWTDSRGNYVYVNPAYADLLGYSREDLLNSSVLEIDPEMNAARWEEHWHELKNRQSLLIERRLQSKDGTSIEVELTLKYTLFEGQEFNIAIARDITERKLALSALQISEAELQTVIEGTDALIMTLDLDGVIQYMNHTVSVGQLEEVVGTSIFQWLDPESSENVQQQFSRTLEEKQPTIFEFDYIDLLGKPHLFFATLSPILLNEEIVKLSLIANDLTEITSLKRDLSRQAELISLSLAAVEMGVVEYDYHSDKIIGDKNVQDIFGCSPTSFPCEYESFLACILEEDRSTFLKQIEQASTNDDLSKVEFRVHKQDSQEIIWVSFRAHFIRNKIGQVTGYRAVIWDNTLQQEQQQTLEIQTAELEEQNIELHAIQAELQMAKRRYEQLYDQAPDMFATIEANTQQIVNINRTFLSKTGYSEEEVLGGHLINLVHPNTILQLRRHFKKLKEVGHIEGARISLQSKSGEKIEVEANVTPIRVEQEEGQHLSVILRDVTARNQLLLALERSEVRFRSLAEQSPVGITLSEKNRTLRYINQAFGEMVGYSVEELKGMDWAEITYPEDQEENLRKFTDLVDGKVSQIQFDKRYYRKDRRVIWCSLIVTLIKYAEEEEELILTTIQDITQRKQQEEAILQTNKEMENLLYVISHDLRAPIRHINGFALRLNKETELGPPQQKRLDTIIDASVRMGNMIDGLLKMSRLKKIVPNKQELDMNQLAVGSLSLFETDINDQAFSCEIEPLPIAYADEEMMRQVWDNLISNAIKFSAHRAVPRIRIWSEEQRTHILFAIKDNGAGFDMRYRDKLFEVFQRLHPRSQFAGNGIGLANVRQIIRQHGGEIWAEGVVDEGATFYFTIPKPN